MTLTEGLLIGILVVLLFKGSSLPHKVLYFPRSVYKKYRRRRATVRRD